MADEVNTDAFNGGDTEATTKAAIAARNAAIQAEADAMRDAQKDYIDAAVTNVTAQNDAEQTAYEADPGLKRGDPIGANVWPGEEAP
jgi:hypothetical protein